jgi:hypothetical protein
VYAYLKDKFSFAALVADRYVVAYDVSVRHPRIIVYFSVIFFYPVAASWCYATPVSSPLYFLAMAAPCTAYYAFLMYILFSGDLIESLMTFALTPVSPLPSLSSSSSSLWSHLSTWPSALPPLSTTLRVLVGGYCLLFGFQHAAELCERNGSERLVIAFAAAALQILGSDNTDGDNINGNGAGGGLSGGAFALDNGSVGAWCNPEVWVCLLVFAAAATAGGHLLCVQHAIIILALSAWPALQRSTAAMQRRWRQPEAALFQVERIAVR